MNGPARYALGQGRKCDSRQCIDDYKHGDLSSGLIDIIIILLLLLIIIIISDT